MEHASSLGLSLLDGSDMNEEGREALRRKLDPGPSHSIHSSFAIYCDLRAIFLKIYKKQNFIQKLLI
ncbi:hypothetical protein [Halomonas sp. QHL1]|uniref:hypothetical protein n=1 Tax=Halomonas sp. QHL1 TaxID=1123773 RepID=UPI0008FD7EC5|nr:hypothetical protein [Halomonas sp. QHL1]OJA04799.1 hypothetical protein QHL1GM_05025 [Halomonas sp. QHL1]